MNKKFNLGAMLMTTVLLTALVLAGAETGSYGSNPGSQISLDVGKPNMYGDITVKVTYNGVTKTRTGNQNNENGRDKTLYTLDIVEFVEENDDGTTSVTSVRVNKGKVQLKHEGIDEGWRTLEKVEPKGDSPGKK